MLWDFETLLCNLYRHAMQVKTSALDVNLMCAPMIFGTPKIVGGPLEPAVQGLTCYNLNSGYPDRIVAISR